MRYGAVAVVVGVVLCGLAIWPSGTDSGGHADQWWLGAPAAWAGQLMWP